MRTDDRVAFIVIKDEENNLVVYSGEVEDTTEKYNIMLENGIKSLKLYEIDSKDFDEYTNGKTSIDKIIKKVEEENAKN